MSEIDTSKCMWQKESNMGVCLLKCEEADCDFKILSKQLHRYKEAIKEIKHIINIKVTQNPDYWNDYVNISYEAFNKIIQKCEDANGKN